MSPNRLGKLDRQRTVEDFEIDQKTELEIEMLHDKIDQLRETEIAASTASVEGLTRMPAAEREGQ